MLRLRSTLTARPALRSGTIVAFLPLLIWSGCTDGRPAPNEAVSGAAPAPADTSIVAVYEARYAPIVQQINTLRQREALEGLQKVDAPEDSIHDQFIQGILYAWLGEYETAAGRLTAASVKRSLPEPGPIVTHHAQRWQLDPTALRDPRFSVDDCLYLHSSYFLQSIAGRVTAGCRTDIESAGRLVDFVFRHVGAFEPRELAMPPYETLMRGYGICDRSAWLLAVLAQRAGLPASVIVLEKSRDTLANHTLCQIHIDGRGLIFDTTSGTAVTIDDEAVSVDEILISLKRAYRDRAFQEMFGPFRDAKAAVVCEAEGVFPRFRLLEPYLAVLPPHPSAYANLEGKMAAVRETFSSDMVRRQQNVGLWDFPFIVLADYSEPAFRSLREADMERMKAYRQARTFQLLGYPEAAIKAYARAAPLGSPEAKDDMFYFAAQCFMDYGKLDDAEKTLTAYLDEYPNGRWRTMAIYHLAITCELQGEPSKAVELYRSLLPIAAARTRMERVAARVSKGTASIDADSTGSE